MTCRDLWPRLAATLLSLSVGVLSPATAHAQEPADADAPQPSIAASSNRGVDTLKFLAGAGVAFVVHESGHLVFNEIFDARPRLKSVHFGPIPFFAISPTRPLSRRKLFTIASAGFWFQELSTELLLPAHRDLRHEHAPFAKGMLAFDVLTSVGYAVVAFAEAGPPERDTRGMATGLRVREPAIGVMVLAPATLAAYRYFRPDSTWARWATRIVAAGSVALVAKP